MKNKIGIAVIAHPPCLPLLRNHLKSIKKSIEHSNSEVPVSFYFSQASDEVEVKVKKMIEEIGISNIRVKISHELTSNQKSKNIALNPLLDKVDWIIIAEADTLMAKKNLAVMLDYLSEWNSQNVGAFCGTIGVMRSSVWGNFEAYFEAMVLLTRTEGSSHNKFLQIFGPNRELSIADAINKNTCSIFNDLAGKPCYRLQGYSCMIKSDVLKARGFDESFASAGDREMLAYIRAERGMEVLLAPEYQVFHDFELNLEQIVLRKVIHGIWTRKVSQKYARYGEEIVGPILGSLSLDRYLSVEQDEPPFPFNRSSEGRAYFRIAVTTYAYGILSESIKYRFGEGEASARFLDHRTASG